MDRSNGSGGVNLEFEADVVDKAYAALNYTDPLYKQCAMQSAVSLFFSPMLSPARKMLLLQRHVCLRSIIQEYLTRRTYNLDEDLDIYNTAVFILNLIPRIEQISAEEDLDMLLAEA